jgi:hypothetical protein
MRNQNLTKLFINPKEAEALYGIDHRTLANLRCHKQGCQFFKRGRSVVYKVQDFEQWLTSRPVKTIEQN